LTHSNEERRIIVSDMRTNKLVKIINEIRESKVKPEEETRTKVLTSKLGKSNYLVILVILGYQDAIEVIDVSGGFKS
jgi:hypothetical protein